MTLQPYLFVKVRLSLYDMMMLPVPTHEAILSWLSEHGIDVTREFSWMDDPGSLQRVYTQRHYKEAMHGDSAS